MIIGGQAVLLHGEPRLTYDIDITLGVTTSKLKDIVSLCKKLNFDILVDNPADFTKKTSVLPALDKNSKIRIDFIFSFTPYEREAIARVVKVDILNYEVCFASTEDLVIHKLFAARPRDIEDAKSVILRHKDKMDIKYIKKWVISFSKLPGKENIKKTLRDLLEISL